MIDVAKAKAVAQQKKNIALVAHTTEVSQRQSAAMQRTIDIAAEKGASSWLSTLQVAAHGFDLSKAPFRDALCLRYGWSVKNLPSTCASGSQWDLCIEVARKLLLGH